MSGPAPTVTRRELLAGSALIGLSGLGACKGGDCPSEPLSADALKARETLKYVDRSPDAQKLCKACVQFLPDPQAACGRCKVVSGPIHPEGYCLAFVAKA